MRYFGQIKHLGKQKINNQFWMFLIWNFLLFCITCFKILADVSDTKSISFSCHSSAICFPRFPRERIADYDSAENDWQPKSVQNRKHDQSYTRLTAKGNPCNQANPKTTKKHFCSLIKLTFNLNYLSISHLQLIIVFQKLTNKK